MTDLVSCSSPSGVPHLAGGADHGRHRGVDDHVAGDVEVGDAAVGVDHGQRRPVLVRGLDRRLDRLALVVGQLLDRLEQRAEPVVGVDADRLQRVAVLGEHVGEEGPHGVAEDDRVRHLHHRRLEVHREQHALRPWRRRSGRRGTRAARPGASPRRRGPRRPARGVGSLSTVTVPSAPTCSIRTAPVAARR